MNQVDTNIYRRCRLRTHLTQEAWAEALGISVESVKRYELGLVRPQDDIVLRMILESNYEALAYQHIAMSTQALHVLPDTPVDLPLSQATIRIINRLAAFFDQHRDRQLMQIAEDGRIDDEERPLFDAIMSELQELAATYYAIRYADAREVS